MNRKTVILSIILLTITVITIIAGRNMYEFRSVCRSPLMPLFKTLTFFSGNMENKHLINDLLSYTGNNIANDAEKLALIAENRELRKILELKDHIQFDMITAEVMERSLDINGCFIIDKGSSSGVDQQMGVMYLNGLIGKIIESGVNSSVVETYLNINYKISITDRDFSDYYICRSGGNGLLYVDIEDNYCFEVGDTVFTSGLGRLYPAGIPVGVFRGYGKLGRDSVFVIDPVQHLNADFIFIIKQKGDSLEANKKDKEKKLGNLGWYRIKSSI